MYVMRRMQALDKHLPLANMLNASQEHSSEGDTNSCYAFVSEENEYKFLQKTAADFQTL